MTRSVYYSFMYNIRILILALMVGLYLSGCTKNTQLEPIVSQEEPEAIEDTSVETLPVVSEAFLNIYDPKQVSRSENGAYYLSGTTSDNCSQVWVQAENTASGLYDNYQLSEFKHGDTTFRYGIREDWNNLAEGENVYTFTAHCDGGQEVTDTASFSYTKPTSSYSTSTTIPTYDYNSSDYSYETYPSYSSSSSYDSYTSSIKSLRLEGAVLVSICNDSYVYLGSFGGKYDSDSIFYKYGDYGSKYSDTSIWYKYGEYGGSYDNCSAFYKYASEPPMVLIDETIIAYVSKNKYAGTTVIDPNELLLYAYQEFDDEAYLELMRD